MTAIGVRLPPLVIPSARRECFRDETAGQRHGKAPVLARGDRLLCRQGCLSPVGHPCRSGVIFVMGSGMTPGIDTSRFQRAVGSKPHSDRSMPAGLKPRLARLAFAPWAAATN